jgi:hypothetical protein
MINAIYTTRKLRNSELPYTLHNRAQCVADWPGYVGLGCFHLFILSLTYSLERLPATPRELFLTDLYSLAVCGRIEGAALEATYSRSATTTHATQLQWL